MDLKKAQELFSLNTEGFLWRIRDIQITYSNTTNLIWIIINQVKIYNSQIIIIKLHNLVKIHISYNKLINLMTIIKEISLPRTSCLQEEQVLISLNLNKISHWTIKNKAFTKMVHNQCWIIIIPCNSMGITNPASPWIKKWQRMWYSTGLYKVRLQDHWKV